MLGKIEKSVAIDNVESPEDKDGGKTRRKPGSRQMKASSERPLQARRSQAKVS